MQTNCVNHSSNFQRNAVRNASKSEHEAYTALS